MGEAAGVEISTAIRSPGREKTSGLTFLLTGDQSRRDGARLEAKNAAQWSETTSWLLLLSLCVLLWRQVSGLGTFLKANSCNFTLRQLQG